MFVKNILTCCNSSTGHKGIASVTRITFAQWKVIDDLTGSKHPTNARTWILALLGKTCQMSGAFCVYNTFWLTFLANVQDYMYTLPQKINKLIQKGKCK